MSFITFYLLWNTLLLIVPYVLLIISRISINILDHETFHKFIQFQVDLFEDHPLLFYLLFIVFPIGMIYVIGCFLIITSIFQYVVRSHYDILSSDSMKQLISLGYKDLFDYEVSRSEYNHFVTAIIREPIDHFYNKDDSFTSISCKKAKQWLFENYGVKITTKKKKGYYHSTVVFLGSEHQFYVKGKTISHNYQQIITKL